jgi:hypothetical protein
MVILFCYCSGTASLVFSQTSQVYNKGHHGSGRSPREKELADEVTLVESLRPNMYAVTSEPVSRMCWKSVEIQWQVDKAELPRPKQSENGVFENVPPRVQTKQGMG